MASLGRLWVSGNVAKQGQMDPEIGTQSHFGPKSSLGLKNWDCKCLRCPNRHCHKTKNLNGLRADTISHLCTPIHSYFNRTNMMVLEQEISWLLHPAPLYGRAGLQSISIVRNNHSLVLQRLIMIGPTTTYSLRFRHCTDVIFPQKQLTMFRIVCSTLPYFGSTYKNACAQ